MGAKFWAEISAPTCKYINALVSLLPAFGLPVLVYLIRSGLKSEPFLRMTIRYKGFFPNSDIITDIYQVFFK